jgi:peroxiredoxin
MRLHDLRGHVVVINFWSPSCAPCGEEAPVLVKVSRAFEARGVQFLGIAFEGSTDDVLNFVHQYEIPFPIATDDGNVVAVAYGLVAIPVTVVVNGAGIIDMVIQGTVLQTNLESGIQTALHAQPHDR